MGKDSNGLNEYNVGAKPSVLLKRVDALEQEIQKLKADREVLYITLGRIAVHSDSPVVHDLCDQALKSIGEIE